MTTITHEQLAELARLASDPVVFAAGVQSLGIIIADPEPPEAMKKLAREIAAKAQQPGPHEWPVAAALTALQFADKVVREADEAGRFRGPLIDRDEIRRKLGAIA